MTNSDDIANHAAAAQGSRILVCKAIDCPYWSDLSGNYGCQRWRVASDCHLIEVFPKLKSLDEYALRADSDSVNLTAIREANDKFFREDPKHQQDAQILKLFPDREGRGFYPSRIISL